MFVRNALVVLALLGGVTVVACSSDPPGDKYPSFESFCGAKAEEECKVVASACSLTEVQCVQTRKSSCVSAANASTSQGRTYRAGNAENCIAKVTEVYKDRQIAAEKEAAMNDACERVFLGSKAKTEACSNPYDCEGSSLVCDKNRCAERVERNEGDGCNNAGEVCKAGFFCKDEGGQRYCRPKQKEGLICDDKNPCIETLRCSNNCIARNPTGTACFSNDDCTTGFCNADKKCGAKLYASETGTCKDFGG
jgi:hypothetical protein